MRQLELEDAASLLPPLPAYLFTPAFYRSPFAVWLCTLFAYPVLLTQSFNRLRSPAFLSPHPQLGWVVVARSRWDQSVAESLIVLLVLWLLPALLIALNAQAQRSPSLQPPPSGEDRREGAQRRRTAPPAVPLSLSSSTCSTPSSVSVWWPSEAAAAEGRLEAQWRCLALLALLFLLFFTLRQLATTSHHTTPHPTTV